MAGPDGDCFALPLASGQPTRSPCSARARSAASCAGPGQVVTHHEPLHNAAGIYDRFDRRVDGIIKAVFRHP